MLKFLGFKNYHKYSEILNDLIELNNYLVKSLY
jgi:hypothetical protein